MSAWSRNVLRRSLSVAMIAGAAMLTASTGAHAETDELGGIDVVQINGWIDPPNAALLIDTIDSAEERGASMVVVQLDSPGAFAVSAAELRGRVTSATVPIIMWVGPSGASTSRTATDLATSGSYLSMASNAKIGDCDPYEIGHAGPRLPFACGPQRVGADEAIAQGIADSTESDLRNLLTNLDGKTVETGAGESVTLSTKIVDPASKQPSVNQDVRFHKLGITGQLQHTLIAPWVAYFLLIAGIGLIVFELYAASIGAATLVGVIALVGSCYGFSHVPVNEIALVLIAVGLFGLTVDLQAGGVGFWTFAGTALLIAGSWFLYDAPLRLAWWVIALVILGTLAFWIGGLPAMLRTRFSTPTIGREGMIGEMGVAEVDVAPDGVVRVRDALWKARINRATPVKAGDAIRVVAVEGLVLEVEPETGGAQDYRERSRRRT